MNKAKIRWDVLAVWVGAVVFSLASWYFLINALVKAMTLANTPGA